jgi:hypothetical protein
MAGLLTGSLFLLPLGEIANKEVAYTFMFNGFIDANQEVALPTLALSILVIAATLVTLISLFLFKKRMLQIRLCGLNMGLLLGTTGMAYYLGTQAVKELDGLIHFKMPIAFPIVAMILTFLAMRAIGKDEALIKSMNRIR